MKNRLKSLVALLCIIFMAVGGVIGYNLLHEPTLEELYQEAEGSLMHAFTGTALRDVEMSTVEEEDRFVIHVHFTEDKFDNIAEEEWDNVVDSLLNASDAWRKVLDKEGIMKKLEFRIGTPDEMHVYLKIVDGEIIINNF